MRSVFGKRKARAHAGVNGRGAQTRHHHQADVTHVFPSAGLKATLSPSDGEIGWGEGQGEGSSEITGLDLEAARRCATRARKPISALPFYRPSQRFASLTMSSQTTGSTR